MGPQLAVAVTASGDPLLMGWLDDAHTVLTPRTTAEVLAYLDLGVPLLPTDQQDLVADQLVSSSALDGLVAAITTVVSGDPSSANLDDPSIEQARQATLALLLPSASRQAAPGVQLSVQFDPLAAKSGITLHETDLNTVVIRNQYRRRARALLDRTGYVAADGSSHTAPAHMTSLDVAPVYGVKTFTSLLEDLVLGNLAWAEVESPPIATPLFPADALNTTYRLKVLGAGLASFGQLSQLTTDEMADLTLVSGKTFVLDLLLPVVTNIVLNKNIAGELINQAVASPDFSSRLSNLLKLMFTTAPNLWNLLWAGDMAGVQRELWKTFINNKTIQQGIFDLVGVITAQMRDQGQTEAFKLVQATGKDVLDAVGRTNIVLTTADTRLQVWQIEHSAAIETWDLTVVPSKVTIDPPRAVIGPLDVQTFRARVPGLENLAGGAILAYKWTTTGQHGKLYDANHRQGSAGFASSSEVVTWSPNLQTGGTDLVTVEVSRVQAGADTVHIGIATATIEVQLDAINLTPDQVTLGYGEQQTFTVDAPQAQQGTGTLSYRWSTSGNFGTLDRGSRSFESPSKQATYTARSATRGEDEVAVEVLLTKDGQTTSLGTDRALVRIERGPFTVEPKTVTTPVDSVVHFMAYPHGDVPPHPRYVWQFGDFTNAVTVVDDSAVTHAFHDTGTYDVTVELQDAVTGRLAGATATVTAVDFTFTDVVSAKGGQHTCALAPAEKPSAGA